MATLIKTYGEVPEWGIGQAEDSALLLTSVDLTTSVTGEYVQKNRLGQTSGVILYDQEQSWSMSGTLVAGGVLSYTLASAVALNNFEGNNDFVDGLGAGADKTAKTAICKEIKRTLGNESAVQVDISGVNYNFTSSL